MNNLTNHRYTHYNDIDNNDNNDLINDDNNDDLININNDNGIEQI